jgi:Domain of unknown function (DUF1707)
VEAFWESFRLDPRQPVNTSMRASDADREIVRGVLADAYTDGRLNQDEYDERLNTLFASRTLGELPAMVSDLVPAGSPPAAKPAVLAPADLRARGVRKWRKDVEEAFAGFLIPTIICTVLWIAITGGGFFWPAFPMLVFGINLLRTLVQRESVIDREVRRLEEKAAKDAAKGLPSGGDPPAG